LRQTTRPPPPTLVERTGSARSFHIDNTSIADIAPIIRMNARRQSRFMIDELRHYKESVVSLRAMTL
jgi:hypothetical protein